MPSPTPSLKGKTCLITGATSGIGFIAARELARAGARLLLVGRSARTADDAARRIREEVAGADVGPLHADLSSQAEIRKLADEVRNRTDRLDVLVNNAGGIFLDRTESVDGIETTFAVNHLAPFLLTHLLLPLLEAAPSARVVTVASGAHRGVAMTFDDLEGRTRYSGWRAYQRSKLANILFTRELARRLKGSSITANSLHPGYVNTQIFRDATWKGRVMRALAGLFAITPEKGAETTIHLASSPEVEGVSGEYFIASRAVGSSLASQDEAAARRLWDVSAEMTGVERSVD
ncbi:SDR family oxidoreductase [Planctomyces sp. SH-PL62]|uniref:SDR family oxidoreductase n=1 Tax=Planctomyces sp. SH-PL62 TaxID=1636152 RepID=UPI00078B839F|nr:SDR family oxidoreductase [Planctomyces sp. SH-PL62]AMV38914.1 Rhamnolipids biosynthesis 3-oxoacyl-[acyl-carrier-protein] reductase [Planctomyces sp. SH-PL62]